MNKSVVQKKRISFVIVKTELSASYWSLKAVRTTLVFCLPHMYGNIIAIPL